jgi:hypothetical protein
MRLADRCRSLLDFVRAKDPTDSLVRTLGSGLAHLHKAHEILEGARCGSLKLSLVRDGGYEPQSRVISRCVQSLMDGVLDPAPEDSIHGEDSTAVPEFRGSSIVLPVAQVLDALAISVATGTLVVSTTEETFTLLLEDGRVINATSDRSPPGCRLGDILVSQGATDLYALEQAIRSARGVEGKCVGDLIRGMGHVTDEQLRTALVEQTQRIFQRLFAQGDSTFVYRQGHRWSADIHAPMSVHALLLEGARRSDEEAS